MNYELHHGDCLEVMRTMGDKSVDCVITDPPYGVNKAEWDAEFPTDWIKEAERVSKRQLVMTGNTALIYAGRQFADYRDIIALYAVNGMTRSRIGFGNFIPVLACGEWSWKARPNVLRFVVDTKETIDHPSPKPLAAMMVLLQKYTEAGEVILDPFMGSGTTGIAALKLGCTFIGIEKDGEYFKIASERIERRQNQQPLFMEAAA